MIVAEWVDIYGIHLWQILWSSYRNLVCVGFEPTATEFRSDALKDWAIRPWVVHLALKAKFCTSTSIWSFVSRHVYQSYIYIYIYIYRIMLNLQPRFKYSEFHVNYFTIFSFIELVYSFYLPRYLWV